MQWMMPTILFFRQVSETNEIRNVYTGRTNNSTEKTQVQAVFGGWSHVPRLVVVEAIGKKESSQSCDFDAQPLGVGCEPRIMIEGSLNPFRS